MLRWSKSNQTGSDKIALPKAKTNILCPVSAWRIYRYSYLNATYKNENPLLLEVKNGNITPFSCDRLRFKLKEIFTEGGFADLSYTPHSLRRGGTSFFADCGVPLQDIKRHGLWRSEAIEVYLRKMSHKNSDIYKTLKEL